MLQVLVVEVLRGLVVHLLPHWRLRGVKHCVTVLADHRQIVDAVIVRSLALELTQSAVLELGYLFGGVCLLLELGSRQVAHHVVVVRHYVVYSVLLVLDSALALQRYIVHSVQLQGVLIRL